MNFCSSLAPANYRAPPAAPRPQRTRRQKKKNEKGTSAPTRFRQQCFRLQCVDIVPMRAFVQRNFKPRLA